MHRPDPWIPSPASRLPLGALFLWWGAAIVPLGRAVGQAEALPSPLVTWEDILPARRGAVLWARNPTADTVWVDSLHVEGCINIRKGGCGAVGLGVALPPGARKALHRLAPAVPTDAFSYQWYLDWREMLPDSVPKWRPRSADSLGVIRT